jgi:hypothetical protein
MFGFDFQLGQFPISADRDRVKSFRYYFESKRQTVFLWGPRLALEQTLTNPNEWSGA